MDADLSLSIIFSKIDWIIFSAHLKLSLYFLFFSSKVNNSTLINFFWEQSGLYINGGCGGFKCK